MGSGERYTRLMSGEGGIGGRIPAQRAEPVLYVAGDKVPQAAIDFVQSAHRVENTEALLVQACLIDGFQLAAQIDFASRAGDDPIKIEGGKGLPLTLQKCEQLLQGRKSVLFAGHFPTFPYRPAAMIASAISVGISG